eukprot:TRINITY_DN84336_c0_g1_i1.p1 TRINITY_DN84336_c0_g1~~TRINITY_DN84336_c0_g1_i1.p1  ORF type:complete len:173 (-),score=12.94 TRINITY_DN84336_c0_g1_i1:78-596(-)
MQDFAIDTASYMFGTECKNLTIWKTGFCQEDPYLTLVANRCQCQQMGPKGCVRSMMYKANMVCGCSFNLTFYGDKYCSEAPHSARLFFVACDTCSTALGDYIYSHAYWNSSSHAAPGWGVVTLSGDSFKSKCSSFELSYNSDVNCGGPATRLKQGVCNNGVAFSSVSECVFD